MQPACCLEVDRTANPMRDSMYAESLDIANGVAKVPSTPGLGVEPDRAAIKEYCVQQTENNHVS